MHQGNVYFAVEKGLCVFKLTGDVSYTSVMGWGRFAEKVLDSDDITNVLVDLSHARYIDSTNLGELAKIAVIVRSRMGTKPTIISPNPDVSSVITCMGLNSVYLVVDDADPGNLDLQLISESCQGQREQARRILEAHKQLTELSEYNQALFADVIKSFRKELDED